MSKTKLMLGDNMESFKKLPDNSIDSVVTDGPYGLSFMNKKWDYDVPSVEFWKEVYRVLKPGGHVLSFGGTRTYHRMAVNIEDAGFEIRDQIQWLYGSGFPKSHNIGKAVDKIQGNDREVVGKLENYQDKRSGKDGNPAMMELVKPRIDIDITKGQSQYEGWGTALKPANEPICVARKPLSEKTIAANVIKWGTGGINIDGCRVECDKELDKSQDRIMNQKAKSEGWGMKPQGDVKVIDIEAGRFPANIILDEIAGEILDEQSGNLKSTGSVRKKDTETDPSSIDRKHKTGENSNPYAGQSGGASRFFYKAKVSKKERNMGLDHFEATTTGGKGHGLDRRCSHCNTSMLKPEDCKCEEPNWITPAKKNSHPTVKPVALMAYLCRLVTPQGGIVLDPFMGSGSTGIAARLEGFRFCGMEMDEDYFKIAESRIENYEKYKEFINV